jgi:arylformamidase
MTELPRRDVANSRAVLMPSAGVGPSSIAFWSFDSRENNAMWHLTRRTLLAGAAVLAGDAALAQSHPPARVKGPLVWLDLDQKELDDAYDQSVYAPNQRQITGRYVTNSEAVRARIGAPKRLAYGSIPIEGLDLYAAKTPNAPVQVFIHGGAWRAGLAKDYATPAEMFVDAGAHFAVVDFNNVIETNGDLMPMARQVRSAVAWVCKNAASFGGDPNRVYVSGHSSGGHLAGVVLATDWGKDFGLPRDAVKGVVCCSGMFDLKPVRLSKRGEYVKFTDEMEQALSAQRHLDNINCPVTLVYGTLETPEFQRQSRDFAAALQAAGKPVRVVVAPGYNHFEVNETLASPYGFFGRAVLEQMKLKPA